MAPMAADTAHSHISLDGNISALASVLMMTSTRELPKNANEFAAPLYQQSSVTIGLFFYSVANGYGSI